jgi:hypothetical protein
MNRAQLATTITRRDAGVEPPWTVSRRVVAGCARFTFLAVNVTAVRRRVTFLKCFSANWYS